MITCGYRCLIVLLACVSVFPSPAAAADDESSDTPLFGALTDELARSLNLRLEGLEPPYFVQYTVDDGAEYRMSATCGALVESEGSRSRVLRTEVRVGSPELDNTNFSGGGFGGGMGRGRGGGMTRGGSAALPLDDDYVALRHAIWLATDGPYKAAVEALAEKRAYLEERQAEERPADFSAAAPVTDIGPRAVLEIDVPRCEQLLRRLSGVFLEFKEIHDATVRLTAGADNRYLVNSEGSRLRTGENRAALTVTAAARAAGGERLTDRMVCFATKPADLPAAEQLLEEIREFAAGLAERARAEACGDYRGPVLFDEQAAPQLFQQLLGDGLADTRDPVGGGRRRFRGSESLEKSLGRRILPRWISVHDDPRDTTLNGQFLCGHYLYDADGVPAERVDLVTDGTLKTLLSARVPTRVSSRSNGHARRPGQPGIGCLHIVSNEGLAAADMKALLLETANSMGLDYAIRVTSLNSGGASPMERMAALLGGRRGGRGRSSGGEAGGLTDPIRIFRVYVADGREEPVRGCEFGEVDLRTLKDILAAGDAQTVFNTANSSVSAPPVLFEELDLYRIEAEVDRKPPLTPPHAR